MSKSFKAILVDDEESARNILSNLLSNFCPEIEVLAKCEDVEQAVIAIIKHKPDLVFLDIEMPNYAGYEITSFFEKIDFEIIFITAYNHYAVKAFELSAVDYLLKPIDIDRLKQAVQKFEDKAGTKNLELSYRVLKESLKTNSLNKIVVPVPGGQKIVKVCDIVAIEAAESYSQIYIVDKSKYLMSKNLKHFENVLEKNQNFVRTHKSWIVNVNFLNNYSKSRMSIIMKNGIEAKLSKYKKELFEDVITK